MNYSVLHSSLLIMIIFRYFFYNENKKTSSFLALFVEKLQTFWDNVGRELNIPNNYLKISISATYRCTDLIFFAMYCIFEMLFQNNRKLINLMKKILFQILLVGLDRQYVYNGGLGLIYPVLTLCSIIATYVCQLSQQNLKAHLYLIQNFLATATA